MQTILVLIRIKLELSLTFAVSIRCQGLQYDTHHKIQHIPGYSDVNSEFILQLIIENNQLNENKILTYVRHESILLGCIIIWCRI